MYIILGATGHVGSAVADTLLQKGEQVTIITRDDKKSSHWKEKGAEVTIADVYDTEALRLVFQNGKRLFLLNPPADPATDTVTEEQKSLASILAALKDSGIEKVVAESTYGAQPGEGIGDLGVLYDMEQGLKNMGIPASIIRAAYYMSNWDASLETAQKEGKVYTLYPADFKLPMVAPQDIGQLAARLLMEPAKSTDLHYMEGPETYSTADVAAAFAATLNKPVEVITTPKEQWTPMLQKMGFSEKSAQSMAKMTAITLESRYEKTYKPDRGTTTIQEYIRQLVQQSAS